MGKLLNADFSRLKTSLFFWICLIGMFSLGIIFSVIPAILKFPMPLQSLCIVYLNSVPVLCALLNSRTQGAEYDSGTIRCKLICGHNRADIYLSNVIICVAAGVAMTAAFALPIIILNSTSPLEMLTCALFISACACLYTLITVIAQKKLEAFVACLFISVPLLNITLLLFDKIYNEYFFEGIYHREINTQMLASSAVVLAFMCIVFLTAGIKIFSKQDIK